MRTIRPILNTSRMRLKISSLTSANVMPSLLGHGNANKASASVALGFSAAACAKSLAYWMKSSCVVTGALSHFNSTIAQAALSKPKYWPKRPKSVVRPERFSKISAPRSRNHSIAACVSPSHSMSAFLQSIMGRPVLSRSSLTNAAVTAMSFLLELELVCRKWGFCPPAS